MEGKSNLQMVSPLGSSAGESPCVLVLLNSAHVHVNVRTCTCGS